MRIKETTEVVNRIRVPFDLPIRKGGKIEKIRVYVSAVADVNGEALFDDASFNEMAQAKAQITNVLGPLDFKRLRQNLGATQAQMGRLLLCGAKTYTRWETGRSLPNKMISNFFRLCFRKELSPGFVRSYPIPATIEINRSPPGLIKICWSDSETELNALNTEGVLL